MTSDAITANDEQIAACDHQRQLDHLDDMCHRIIGMLDQLEPHMPRLQAMLDPAKSMRVAFRKGGSNGR